ncbi:MAG: F0F1 ATP synthase subunit delta [Geodermatophilaceae bacterium]|nr:F0F1 ATP synthase subunit delta [Geodermatophilaceae bacterium]
MQAASREALRTLSEALDNVSEGTSGTVLLSVADELFAVVGVLENQHALRRALADTSTDADARAGLADRLFSDKVRAQTAAVLESAVRVRWSLPSEFAAGLERLAVQAAFLSAEADDKLDTVEDELFRFGRIIAGRPELQRALSDSAASNAQRGSLVDALVGGKVHAVTERLLAASLTGARARHAEQTVEELSDLAALRRQRSIAQITTSVGLTDEQEQRLVDSLSRIYNRRISLQISLAPELLGGLVVRVGDEIIDGSTRFRLAAARQRLAR